MRAKFYKIYVTIIIPLKSKTSVYEKFDHTFKMGHIIFPNIGNFQWTQSVNRVIRKKSKYFIQNLHFINSIFYWVNDISQDFYKNLENYLSEINKAPDADNV